MQEGPGQGELRGVRDSPQRVAADGVRVRDTPSRPRAHPGSSASESPCGTEGRQPGAQAWCAGLPTPFRPGALLGSPAGRAGVCGRAGPGQAQA